MSENKLHWKLYNGYTWILHIEYWFRTLTVVFFTNYTLYLSRVLTTTNIDESHFWIIRVCCALNVRKLPIICCNQISGTICRIYYDGALYYYLFAGVYGKGYEMFIHAVNRIKIDVLPRVIRNIIKLTCYTSLENMAVPFTYR